MDLETQRSLYSGGLQSIFRILQTRFKLNVNIILDIFKHSKFQLRDIAEDLEVFNYFI